MKDPVNSFTLIMEIKGFFRTKCSYLLNSAVLNEPTILHKYAPTAEQCTETHKLINHFKDEKK